MSSSSSSASPRARVETLSRHVTSAAASASGWPSTFPPPSDPLKQPPRPLPSVERTYEDVTKLSLEELRSRYGLGKRDAVAVDGVNHIAFVTHDMAKTIWFWCEVLGMRLTKTLELPGNAQHFFIEGGRGAAIAYFYFPDAPKKAPGVGSVDMDALLQGKGFATAHGSVNHVAFNVPFERLKEYRARVKQANVGYVSPILYHSDVDPSGYSPAMDENTTWVSFYFSGPSSEYLEFTAQTPRSFTPERDVNHRPLVEGS